MRTRVAAVALVAAFMLSAKPLTAVEVSASTVDRAVTAGVAFLRSTQQSDGSWRFQNKSWDLGATALAALAVTLADTPAADPALAAAANFILRTSPPDRKTYQYALKIMALAALDPGKYRQQITMAAHWLQDAQLANGRWNYNKSLLASPFEGDNSNTQFGILGLHSARLAGVPISNVVMQRTEKMLLATQNKDGGWGYRHSNPSRLSMTAAAIATLYITGHQLHVPTEVCGQYRQDTHLAAGMAYLTKHQRKWFAPQGFLYYTLYAIERVGVLSGQKALGKHDWYLKGAEFLLRSQQPDGSWKKNPVDTGFALLFLLKGKSPLVVNKLRWRGEWNHILHDIQNLTRFYGRRIGENVGWQVVDIDAPLEELVKAPVLFLNGMTELKFTTDQIGKLREYVRNGGVIWAEACEGRMAFHTSLRALVAELWPRRKLQLLPADHPVYNIFYTVDVEPFVYAVNVGCRLGLIYHKRDMSCLWEKKRYDTFAYKVGVNALHYLTSGRRLIDRLAEVRPIASSTPPDFVPGALTLAQLRYPGEWETDPDALDNLADFLRTRLNMNVSTRKAVVSASSDEAFAYPIIFMTGHDFVPLTDAEIARLRVYLERGGSLLAEACCGRTEFDISMRRLARKLLPGKTLDVVPASDPLYRSAFAIESVQYKAAVLKKAPDLTAPSLEGVRLGDRWAVIYSKHSLGCSWENHVCPGCIGVERDDALKLGANIIVYVLSH